MTEKKTHHGRNVKRIREILGVKQEALAYELGEDWDQKKVSRLEEKDIIEDELMEQISKILKVPVEAIKNFDDDKTVQIITNTFNEGSINHGGGSGQNNYCTFNPLDKVIELYERMLKEKDTEIDKLKKK